MVSAILLAAGESRRMGKPKQLLPLGKSTILGQAIDNLLDSEVSEVIVVVGYMAGEMIKAIARRPVKIGINPLYSQGMSTSIAAGLKLIDDGARAIMLALADQPFIGRETINRLIAAFADHNKGIVFPSYQGRRGPPIIFAVKYKEELSGLKGDVGGKEIIEQHPDDTLEVTIESESVNIDIDNINDYQSLSSGK